MDAAFTISINNDVPAVETDALFPSERSGRCAECAVKVKEVYRRASQGSNAMCCSALKATSVTLGLGGVLLLTVGLPILQATGSWGPFNTILASTMAVSMFAFPIGMAVGGTRD